MADLCLSCENCLCCGVWGEKKCKALKTRIYSKVDKCQLYKKRGKNFKESKCQCDDCFKNEDLYEEK